MSRTYTISDLAKEFDLTTRTIRFYEDEGLLTPERRGQARIYSAGDRVRLMLILRGKRLGFSLAECKEIFDLYDPSGDNTVQLNLMLDKLALRRQALEQQLRDIRQMQQELDVAEKRIRDALTGAPSPKTRPEEKTT
ncbi:MAG TPA: MerR family DNA-binding transcriptional regulator [Moraxellaceae bacterium]|nr:MerR family DNA-binding transcriptional regulator [Moraxellaceae bacterium]